MIGAMTNVIILDDEDWEEFVRVMNNPGPPTPAAIEANWLHAQILSDMRAGRPITPEPAVPVPTE